MKRKIENYSFLAKLILALPRVVKRAIVIFVDVTLCFLSVWLAYYLRQDEFVEISDGVIWAIAVSLCIALPLFISMGLYRAIFRYSGTLAFLAVVRAVSIYGILYATIFYIYGVSGVPHSIGLIQPLLLFVFICGVRGAARLWLGDHYQNILGNDSDHRVLIYGAGMTGRQLVDAISNNHDMHVIGFLDNDIRLHGHILNGKPIYSPRDLDSLVKNFGITDVLLAMPKLNRKNRNKILEQVSRVHVAVRTIPTMNDLVKGNISISDIRELDIDDLLGREPVIPDQALLEKKVSGKIVMVTGAGGSIGSELCRQILSLCPSKLILFEQSEYALYSIHQELDAMNASGGVIVLPLLGSVQDQDSLGDIIKKWRPDTIFHAAAYKHVPLVESNPVEGIRNNVFGSLRTALAAVENDVSDFVLISTDKAVRPTNIMGASKRLAEMILQALSQNNQNTKFSIVRFGNVLGSSGSVVPKFRRQIRDGGPITLTHPDITRYFMTIPEAAQLVIQASSMAEGGDVFVLDMGEPIKIMELARRMVELSGMTLKDEENPDGDIEILITGLRPGEKLYEELLIGNNSRPTSHPRILRAEESFVPWIDLESDLNAMERSIKINNIKELRTIIERLVSDHNLKIHNIIAK